MDPEPLARLRTVLASFPSDPAYEMSALPYNPAGHEFDRAATEDDDGVGLPTDYKRLLDGYGNLVVGGIFIVSADDLLSQHEAQASGLRSWFAGAPR
jgi:hypothetical protein